MLKIKEQKGLTIFELTVTFVLALIIMSAAGAIYIHFMNAWSEDRSRLEIQRQGTYALVVMERNIKQGTDYKIENYGSGINNKITIKNIVNAPTGAARNIDYYWDPADIEHYKPIKEKDAQETIILPDTYIKDGTPISDFGVENLTFTEGTVGKTIRIDLKLKKPKVRETEVEEVFDFTVSARLRNENVN